MRWSLIVIGLLIAISPAEAQSTLPDGFFGDWQGVALTANTGGEGLGLELDDLNVRIGRDGDGFKMHWTALDRGDSHQVLARHPVEARFTPTDRPGVFAFQPQQSSLLLSLFGDPETNNPLKGEPLLWARVEGETLSIYGLAIGPDGNFDLYQHVRTLTGEGMFATQTHRTEHEPPVILEGRLERSGG